MTESTEGTAAAHVDKFEWLPPESFAQLLLRGSLAGVGARLERRIDKDGHDHYRVVTKDGHAVTANLTLIAAADCTGDDDINTSHTCPIDCP